MILSLHNILRLLLLFSFGFPSILCMASTPVDTAATVKTLQEVVVTGEGAERNLKATEMGRHSLSSQMLLNLPVMFGEPDIVKALQTLPGVSQGIEGFTGLYVRGGENDQNLFLYQGLPLYQVSHLGGIFSSFNVATVSNVDFYKAAFPARYGGRISSITDISVSRPDFEKYQGRISVGLLSVNGYVSGPIIKNKTAFSAAIRRSWIDLVSIPMLAIINNKDKDKGQKHIAYYNFTDFNARIDHKFNNRASAYIVGYYGHDDFKIGLREFLAEDNQSASSSSVNTDPTDYYDENTNKMSWGNWGVIGNFQYNFDKGLLNTSVYYSSYNSNYRQNREYQTDLSEADTYGYNRSKTKNSINDIGIKADFLSSFSQSYTLNVGIGYINHNFLPVDLYNEWLAENVSGSDNYLSSRITAHESYAFIDNILDLGEKVALNFGIRASLFNVKGKTFFSPDPRATIRFSVTDNYSIKLSYARMSQCVQQISNNYISLPTDLWQPITPNFRPITSDQLSAGVYGSIPFSMYFSAEIWYKWMRNILEYKEGQSALKTGMNWEDKLTSGKGWSYGLDVSLTKDAGAFTGTLGYGLMWNWRKFDNLNNGIKFPAKFDNRHKFNINLQYRLNKKIEFNAGWVYMTGNRLSLSMYDYETPDKFFPDAPGGQPTSNVTDQTGLGYLPSRNNIRIPAYNRLDLGMNINRFYKNGRKGIWNISIYNAYCRMNPITIQKAYPEDYLGLPSDKRHRSFRTLSFIPIIPSVSYTYIF